MARIVCVHGIGDPAPDYWMEWAEAIKKAIGDSNTYDGAYWEDAVGGGRAAVRRLARSGTVPRRPSREDRLREQLQALIRQNERGIAAARALPGPGPMVERRGVWDYVGDFVQYILDGRVRDRVQDRVRTKLLEDPSATTSIVAHSWGTVVAYDVLHQLARTRRAFACANFLTFGSPLWMGPVRAILADGGTHGKPANVGNWINVYNTLDPVGPTLAGGLDPSFGGTLDRDERVEFLAWNPHGILNYLGDDAVAEILREALSGVGLRVFVRGPHVDRKAVIVGINNYGVVAPKLNGCVNDALQVADLLRRRYGFAREHLRVLTDERATQDAILERLAWLVSDARDGDQLVFHFSGHGSQVRDRNGDELDALDEIICPYDLDWDRPFTDDVFARYFDHLPAGVALTAILDSCHSGTALRDLSPDAVDRFLLPPPDIRNRAARRLADRGPYFSATLEDPRTPPRPLIRRRAPERDGYQPVLIAGCRSDQTSADIRVDDDYHGALTYALVRSLDRARGRLTYRELIRQVRQRVKAMRTTQTPQLEGPAPRLRRPAFRG